MTLYEIADLVEKIVPGAQHYFTSYRGRAYAYWEETRQLPLHADGVTAEEKWHFVLHYFATRDFDPKVAEITSALEQDDRVTVQYVPGGREDDQGRGGGLVHHIWDCEG